MKLQKLYSVWKLRALNVCYRFVYPKKSEEDTTNKQKNKAEWSKKKEASKQAREMDRDKCRKREVVAIKSIKSLPFFDYYKYYYTLNESWSLLLIDKTVSNILTKSFSIAIRTPSGQKFKSLYRELNNRKLWMRNRSKVKENCDSLFVNTFRVVGVGVGPCPCPQ